MGDSRVRDDPRATDVRTQREATKGRPSGRTQEIQRLIGRSLRSVTQLTATGERTLWIDCDVIQADGGTRTAAITGGFVALALAFKKMKERDQLFKKPLLGLVAATSVGMLEGTPCLDLRYRGGLQGRGGHEHRPHVGGEIRGSAGDRREDPFLPRGDAEDARPRQRRDSTGCSSGSGAFCQASCLRSWKKNPEPAPDRHEERGKFAEIAEALVSLHLELRGAFDLAGVPDCPEGTESYEANAVAKALHYAAASGLPTLADDSGIEVAALDGARGGLGPLRRGGPRRSRSQRPAHGSAARRAR
jgi:hypothetical protein